VTPPPDLPGFLGTIAPLLDHWGYLAVGSLVLLEDFGVPVPGETVLIAASVYAGAGRLQIAAVIVIGFLAAIIGDSIGYSIGRFGGRRLVLRYGKYVFITPKRLDAAERFFTRHGGKIVTIARFVEGLRQANGIIAGMTGMRWRRFVSFNVLGALLWVGVWTSLGYLTGANLTTIWNAIGRYQPYAYAALGVLVAGLVVWHLRRRRRDRGAGDPPQPVTDLVPDRVTEEPA
jgi:membrane protein DedA with SNARE-associated domain